MKTFKQFITETKVDLPCGIFVKVTPTTSTILKIKDRFSALEQPPLPKLLDDLHCTVIYTKENASVDLPVIDKDGRYKAIATELVHWEGSDKDGYIVLKLVSPAITNLHYKFRQRGLNPTFKDYNPHVSLVHPVPDISLYKTILEELNEQLKTNPIVLEFYYGGYSINEETEESSL